MIGRRKKRAPSGIRPEQRAAVLLRDAGYCARCGMWLANVPASVHHRLPRGRGGDDRISGLLTLCGSGTTGCHGEVESLRSDAYRDGFLVRTGVDPATVPVLTHAGLRYLTDAGELLTSTQYLERVTA